MFRLTLRKKLLIFAIVLALIPLALAGTQMIRITQDELKSFLNEDLIATADQIAQEIDNHYLHSWQTPLLMIKRVVENDQLGAHEKTIIMQNIRDVPDIVSLQITIEGATQPLLITQDEYRSLLVKNNVSPDAYLNISPTRIDSLLNSQTDPENAIFLGDLTRIPQINNWLVTIIIPLKEIAGRKATLSARARLDKIQDRMQNHPFSKNGQILLLDAQGREIFDPQRSDYSHYSIVTTTRNLLKANTLTSGVTPYIRPNGDEMLAGYAFPTSFNWIVIVQKQTATAYLAVSRMVRSLLTLALVGLLIAVIGAIIFSRRLTWPILEIGKVVRRVGQGDFDVRVIKLRANDEITELAQRINQMISELRERFTLMKFVSGQTMEAIKNASNGEIKLGGQRKTVTVFFSDIRGFTAFSEKNPPEIVINMLNTYLRSQAQIVRDFQGDIDKYVGDELIAVFQGPDMVKNALMCALKIQNEMKTLNQEFPEWSISVGIGINTGEIIMGAMGSEERMDYTILGDHVNLGSRLCSSAGPGEIVMSAYSNSYLNPELVATISKELGFESLEVSPADQIQVKGKTEPIEIYRVSQSDGSSRRYQNPESRSPLTKQVNA